ncbi:lactonase family protein [Lacticaseibacillus zeae]|uniref:Lactonase family protein n=1 Tax=Lacticaseibacillus zeae subsp. silagei TaxID=3068307 RepID=A0ABD7ZBA8_LACZE|nr:MULTISPECIES: lactonase family protein [Lacticaseibacillus]MDE3314769.1 lactonase family protein [Lacticaseibacillus zeae]OFR91211.1 6-phosphogluconolactonase [Lactobacillus sp. HMSC068F07]WLV84376.1 lactonase family protein [Lacticaseibacillus sp. NCIMB 15475]WLV87132.1 lactonase family protein [Lacticaseibacillus sp. NCIMB 15474]
MKQRLLLGGYTRHGGAGIYAGTFDDTQGQLAAPTPLISDLGSPTYLAVSDDNILYAVDAEGDQGGVASYDLNTNPPRLINRVLTPGSSPAHVSIDENRQLVYASNYHEGRINVYKINRDHSLTATDEVVHSGNGPRPEQDSAHVHFAAVTPDFQRLAVVDLGNDTLTTYAVSDAGKLSDPIVFHTEPGFGPRHIAFNHNQPIAYLLGELSSKVSVLSYDAGTGSFELITTLPTIPADYTDHNGAAAIRLSSDQRFLYVSNRGFNSLTVFAVSPDGRNLTQLQQISTAGDFPRDFNFDLTERYILAVNQNTSNGTLYSRDPKTGTLTEQQRDIPTPEAVNVLFLADK